MIASRQKFSRSTSLLIGGSKVLRVVNKNVFLEFFVREISCFLLGDPYSSYNMHLILIFQYIHSMDQTF